MKIYNQKYGGVKRRAAEEEARRLRAEEEKRKLAEKVAKMPPTPYETGPKPENEKPYHSKNIYGVALVAMLAAMSDTGGRR